MCIVMVEYEAKGKNGHKIHSLDSEICDFSIIYQLLLNCPINQWEPGVSIPSELLQTDCCRKADYILLFLAAHTVIVQPDRKEVERRNKEL